MELNWSIADCENWQELPRGTVECMVFASMFVGISRIKESNWQEFATRLRMWEKVHGPIRSDGELMDPGVVRDFIGMSTNASSLTPAKFATTLVRSLREKSRDEVQRAQS
jgi:hypothetical protein